MAAIAYRLMGYLMTLPGDRTEKDRAYDRRWYKKNRKKKLAYMKSYYDRNRVKIAFKRNKQRQPLKILPSGV